MTPELREMIARQDLRQTDRVLWMASCDLVREWMGTGSSAARRIVSALVKRHHLVPLRDHELKALRALDSRSYQ